MRIADNKTRKQNVAIPDREGQRAPVAVQPAVRFEDPGLILEITRHTERLQFIEDESSSLHEGWFGPARPVGSLAAEVLTRTEPRSSPVSATNARDLERLQAVVERFPERVHDDGTWAFDLFVARLHLEYMFTHRRVGASALSVRWHMTAKGPRTDVFMLLEQETAATRDRMHWLAPPAWDQRVVVAETPAAAVLVSLFEGFLTGGLGVCPSCGTLFPRSSVQRKKKRCQPCGKSVTARRQLPRLKKQYLLVTDRIRRKRTIPGPHRSELRGAAYKIFCEFTSKPYTARAELEALQALNRLAPPPPGGRRGRRAAVLEP